MIHGSHVIRDEALRDPRGSLRKKSCADNGELIRKRNFVRYFLELEICF